MADFNKADCQQRSMQVMQLKNEWLTKYPPWLFTCQQTRLRAPSDNPFHSASTGTMNSHRKIKKAPLFLEA